MTKQNTANQTPLGREASELSGVICADCRSKLPNGNGPKDGWQLEDGRTVCHACCVTDTHKIVTAVVNERRKLNCVASDTCQVNFETRH